MNCTFPTVHFGALVFSMVIVPRYPLKTMAVTPVSLRVTLYLCGISPGLGSFVLAFSPRYLSMVGSFADAALDPTNLRLLANKSTMIWIQSICDRVIRLKVHLLLVRIVLA